jgi:hypothetical protein
MNPAICCGKRIIAKTTAIAVHSKIVLTSLPRMAHCFARCCCHNPTPISATESPNSQGRNVVKKALAAPAPNAAAKPNGRQQLTVAMEVRIAAKDAEKPVACFTSDLPFGLRARHGEPTRLEEVQFASTSDTGGNSVKKFRSAMILPQRRVR